MTVDAKNKREVILFTRNLIILAIFAFMTAVYINRTGPYPWGSDTYGHLFKGNILYDSFKEGKLFLNYHESWYNGIQPFRYWAPLPYYILAVINLFTGDIFAAYNFFIAFIFFIGGFGWLCWGFYLKRQNLGLLLAVLWFFVPNNLRILFSEGNLPYVTVNSLIPLVMLCSYRGIKEGSISSNLLLAVFMLLLTLSHAMLTAMTGVALFIFTMADFAVNRRFHNNFVMLIYAFLGIMTAGFWLYPALKGGIFSLNQGAVASVMRDLTYYLKNSLNPVLRFSNIEIYYFGLAFAFAAAFGLLFSQRNQRAHFITALVILFGTTKAALPLLEKLPLNQLFWMSRFTSIAMAMILIGIMLWKSLRKVILAVLIILLVFDSAASFFVLGFNGVYPEKLAAAIDKAVSGTKQRIAVMDISTYGSFPSYYIPYTKTAGADNQVFGWAWQGAATARNIVMLNTALEMGYYSILFDRALELGADTLLIKKSFISNYQELSKWASATGYERRQEDEETITYSYPTQADFGTKVRYEGLAIGQYAENAVYIFPKLTMGESSYIDAYDFQQLKAYKAIYLSGFKYKDRQKAEELLLKLSTAGVRIVLDVTGMQESFLGVSAEPIVINKGYQEAFYKGNKVELQPFPLELSSWKTSFLHGIDMEEGYQVINHRLISYIGSKHNKNITFTGLNIPYFAFLTKDEAAIAMLEDAFGMKAYQTPKRTVHPIAVSYKDNLLRIDASDIDVIVPLAALDAFEASKGSFSIINNLIRTQSRELEIIITYPYLGAGIALSSISLLLIIGMTMIIRIIDNKTKNGQLVGK